MLISVLRTVVPALWGSLIGWTLTVLPLLEPLRADLLAYGDLAVPFIGALIIGAWYAAWRKLEPHVPDWVTRIFLGSAKAPTYANQHTIPGELADPDQADVDDLLGYPVDEPHAPTTSPERDHL